jgi:hypothetical protein
MDGGSGVVNLGFGVEKPFLLASQVGISYVYMSLVQICSGEQFA